MVIMVNTINASDPNAREKLDNYKKDIISKNEATCRYRRNVALGTGITALIALISIIVLSILFPPAAIAFSVGVSLSVIALLALATTSVAFGVKTAKLAREIEQLKDVHFMGYAPLD